MAKNSNWLIDALISLFENYKGMRRLILLFLSIMIGYLTITMIKVYLTKGTIDTSYTQVLLAYIGVYGTIVSFYTRYRSLDDNAKQQVLNEHTSDSDVLNNKNNTINN